MTPKYKEFQILFLLNGEFVHVWPKWKGGELRPAEPLLRAGAAGEYHDPKRRYASSTGFFLCQSVTDSYASATRNGDPSS